MTTDAWTNSTAIDDNTVINLRTEKTTWRVGDKVELETTKPETVVLTVSSVDVCPDGSVVLELRHNGGILRVLPKPLEQMLEPAAPPAASAG